LLIEKTVDILHHYYELGQRERKKKDEEGLVWHGTGYVWHGFYFNTIQPAMERDGVPLHASYVLDGPAEVSERERDACKKLRNYDIEMQNLVWGMYEIDEENNARVHEDVSRLMAQVEDWLLSDKAQSDSRPIVEASYGAFLQETVQEPRGKGTAPRE
jgi:hypothetical protein